MCDDAKEEADLHEIVTAGLFVVLLLRLWMHLLILPHPLGSKMKKRKSRPASLNWSGLLNEMHAMTRQYN